MPNQFYDDKLIDPTFRTVCSTWMKKIDIATRHRRRVFIDDANECYRFYIGHRHWSDAMASDIGGLQAADLPSDPAFKVSVNKTFEFVTLFGPTLYYQNPVRTVKPRQPVIVPPQFFPMDPMLYQAILQQENIRIQQEGLRSVLLEGYLNWSPNEFHLESESRMAIDEALIKGRGLLYTELYTPPGSEINMVRSVWDTVDHLYIDPDAGSIDKAKWIARKCIEPVWKVETDYGLKQGCLKGNMESQARHGEMMLDEDADYNRLRGQTNDLLVYYKFYSKMGAGGRLQGIAKNYREPLETLGDYVYLVIADNCTFPLNLPPDTPLDREEVLDRLSWPTPYWRAGEWPFTELDFHKIFQCPWPRPHLKAGMGELKFLNWVTSFLMGKIRNTCRDFIAIRKEAGEEIKSIILNGGDLTLLELESSHGTISELVSFLQHPEVNGDIWKMIVEVEKNFDKRVGLNELMYGMQGESAMRSAEEASIRDRSTQIRPDDMRKQVEAWMSRVAAKEGMACRWHLNGKDVSHVFGAMGAQAWDQYVASRDLDEIAHQLEYRIESGSTARPNRDAVTREMNTALQTIGPIFQGYAQTTGDFMPLNNMISDWAKAHDLDPAKYQLRASPPPQPTSPDEEVRGVQKDLQNAEVPAQ